MTKTQKLLVQQSEKRERVNELLGIEERSDEQNAEMGKLTGELQKIEPELRAAISAEGIEEPPKKVDDKLSELEGRCSVATIFSAVLEHRQTDGAENELQTELKLRPNQIPLALLRGARMEERAVTPAPDNVGRTQQPIIPSVFPDSVADFLHVDMPSVPVGESGFPVLTTGATVHTPAKNAAAAETEGAFSAEVLAPRRLQASFFYSREDAARFAGMDSALRENLSMALADALDKEVLVGTNGLLTGTNLADHDATNETTFQRYLSELMLARVDGKWATRTQDIRIVVGSETYADCGVSLAGSGGNMDAFSALDRLMALTDGIRVSAHVPVAASAKQEVVVRRGSRRDMVVPLWEGVTLIPDEVTKASTGQIVLTGAMMHAVKILRADGFWKQETQHA